MKHLKSLLIGLFCLVATLPIVYTNNVYAYEEVSIATFSLSGRNGYTVSPAGSNSYTVPNILNFSDYSLMTVTVSGWCENRLSSVSNSITVTAENYDTGEVQTLATKTLHVGSFSDAINFDFPSGWNRGKITITYSWSGLKMQYEDPTCYASSRIDSGSITGIIRPEPTFEASGNLTRPCAYIVFL